jgi:hypothetical protein
VRDHVERDAGLEVGHGAGMVNTGVKSGEFSVFGFQCWLSARHRLCSR